MRSRFRALPIALIAAGLLLLAAAPAVAEVSRARSQTEAQAVCIGDAPYAEVDIETRPRLTLEVASTPEQRQVGLMYRPSMPWDQGMLFIFEREGQGGFWMRNTLIPLSIAWLDPSGAIVDIQDMQPLSDDVHTPVGPYLYAIETNQGWFEANGVGVGQRIQLCTTPTAPAPAPAEDEAGGY